ncbi:MAG: NTP transferase domain-containing protein [Clostridia bacterium]|nr:NTP transferase domain-containing protein [Clostridia bacterium]
MEINAIILAGGKGTRLRPLTNDTPKPMLKIANEPVLTRVINWLNGYKIDDITITAGYKSEVIENYAKTSKRKLNLVTETKPLGTAGAVLNAQNYLSDTFIVASGDALTDLNIEKMLKSHRKSGRAVTLAVTEVENPTLYGVVKYDKNGKVTQFVEKPNSNQYGSCVNTGIYIIEKRALDLIPKGVEYDFSRNLFPQLLLRNEINAYRHEGYWCDIGDKTSFYKACYYHKTNGKNANLLGENAKVLGVAKNCIVGNNATILPTATLKNCILLDGATVDGEHQDEIIGRDFALKIEKNDKFLQIPAKKLNIIPISRP